MTFEEIKNMTFAQVTFLFEEHNKEKNERMKQYQNFLKKYGKDAFPVIDIAKGISD